MQFLLAAFVGSIIQSACVLGQYGSSMGFGFQSPVGSPLGQVARPFYPTSSWSNSVYDWNDNPCKGISCGVGRYCEPLNYVTSTGSSSYRCRRYPSAYDQPGNVLGTGVTTGGVYGGGVYGGGVYGGGLNGVGTTILGGGSTVLPPGSGIPVSGVYPIPINGGINGGIATNIIPGQTGTINTKKVGRCFDEVVYKVPAGSGANDRNRMSMPGTYGCPDQCFRNQDCDSGRICCNNGCGNICYTPETTVIDTVNGNTNWAGPYGTQMGLLGIPYRQGDVDVKNPMAYRNRMANFVANNDTTVIKI